MTVKLKIILLGKEADIISKDLIIKFYKLKNLK